MLGSSVTIRVVDHAGLPRTFLNEPSCSNIGDPNLDWPQSGSLQLIAAPLHALSPGLTRCHALHVAHSRRPTKAYVKLRTNRQLTATDLEE